MQELMTIGTAIATVVAVLVGVVVTIVVAYAGFMYATAAGGSPEDRDSEERLRRGFHRSDNRECGLHRASNHYRHGDQAGGWRCD